MIPEIRNYDLLTCLFFLQCLQWVIIKHNKKHYFKIIKLFLKYNDKPGLFFFLDIRVKVLGIIWTMVVSPKLSQLGELHAVTWAAGCTMPEVPFTLCSVEWHLVRFPWTPLRHHLKSHLPGIDSCLEITCKKARWFVKAYAYIAAFVEGINRDITDVNEL